MTTAAQSEAVLNFDNRACGCASWCEVAVDEEVKRLVAQRKAEEEKRRKSLNPLLAEVLEDNLAVPKKVPLSGSAEERFADYLAIRDGHWFWEGPFHSGVPILYVEGKSCRAARFAYQQEVGVIDGKLFRTCEEPSCVNPAHHKVKKMGEGRRSKRKRMNRSSLSTKYGREMAARARTINRGGLSRDDILYIRARYAEGDISYKSLAEKVGVDWSVVSAIVLGRMFRDVT